MSRMTSHQSRSNQHDFARIPSADIQRSSFDRSHGHKTTFDAGFLIPFFVDEALPGDTMNMSTSILARLSTPLVRAMMDNIHLDTFFFAVPNRLLWDNWEKFNGAQDDPGDSTDFEIPYMDTPVGGYAENTIYDYMGIPTKEAGIRHSALWLRAYNFIFDEWFRDENLQDSLIKNRDNGPDTVTDYQIMRRGKRHDYFTSCLPFAQKGVAVELPLGLSAPVVTTGDATPTFDWNLVTNEALFVGNGTTDVLIDGGAGPVGNALGIWNDPKLETDLTAATAATINQIREAFQIQRLFERDARGGTRYTEILRSHFGVTSPDARLQRPEYLGGSHSMMQINPVAATAFTSGATNGRVGDVAAYGVVANTGGRWMKSFTEHCVIVGLICCRADLNYQQGLERMWSRSTRFDFYWPAFSHLGEQSVLNKEILADGSAADDLVFGYQERYAEYRYKPSRITGQFRSNAAAPLDVFHLAQDFAALPVLDDTFIQENPPMDRILITGGIEPHILMDSWFDYKCARPMPTFSVPGMVDHF